MLFAAFEKLRTPVWTYDFQHQQVVWANSSALQLWQVAGLQDLTQASAGEFVPLPNKSDYYLEAFRQGQAVQEVWTIYLPDQPPIAIQCTCSSFLWEDGRLAMLVEGHGVQAPLADPEILQMIVDHIPIMLACSDAQGRTQFINRSLETVMGWSLVDWQQRDLWSECLPDPEQQERALAHIKLANGQWQDFAIRTAQGQTLDTAWAHIRLSDGRLIRIGQDISQRKQAEATLQQQVYRDRLMMQIAQRISQSLELQDIFDIAVAETRQLLGTHRVFVCRLDPIQLSSTIVAESVAAPYQAFQASEICPYCSLLTQKRCCLMTPDVSLTARVPQGGQWVTDIFHAELSEAEVKALRRFSIRAFLSIPIFQQERLWGILVAQHCKEPRAWQETEVHMMKQLAEQLAIAIQQTSLYQQLQQANRELQHIATHDKLTGLANRRQFDTYLHQEWQRHLREAAPLSMILCDIDHFKLYNDTFGHLAGDDCLVQVAQAISRAVKRPTDLVARYGGEEFAIILPNTNLTGATYLAEQIREAVNRRGIPHFSSLVKPQVTLSLGIASVYPSLPLAPEQFVAMTDRALYQAKQSGRDRYCLAH
jgi:diguanylate cyclase (GGDEF)-like protein/PAS domain S-box-containing protein